MGTTRKRLTPLDAGIFILPREDEFPNLEPAADGFNPK
jgi:hypothetical protein